MPRPAFSYTNTDFAQIMEAIRFHLQTHYGTVWKDFAYEGSVGTALVEILAGLWDILLYYIDVKANEQFLPTARDLESIVRIGKLCGYQLRPRTNAAVVCVGTLETAQEHDVIIPEGTVVRSDSGVDFESATEQRIAAGYTTASLIFTEGLLQTETFAGDGTAFQKFTLANADAVRGTMEVSVDGVPWSWVQSLVYADEGDEVYTVEYDKDRYATICFGDGLNGSIPPAGAVIEVKYRIGGGVKGNIPAGDISTTIDGYLEGVVPTQYVEVAIRNEEPGSGGEEPETIEHARFWIPAWIATAGRAVTEADFDVLANTFTDPVYGAPAFAKAKLHQKVPERNLVDIYVWARDYAGEITAPSSGLKNALYSYFMNNSTGAVRLICTDVQVLDGHIVYIDLTIHLRINGNYAVEEVQTAAEAALNNLFNSPTVRPGADLHIGDIYQALEAVDGVESSIIRQIVASYLRSEILGTGDGSEKSYHGTVTTPDGLPMAPYSVRIEVDDLVVFDDGNGNLTGDVDPSGTNTVDYSTGAYNVTFSEAPGDGSQIVFQYRYVLDYSRSDSVGVGDGSKKEITGSVEHPPIVPFRASSGTKGIQISDGTQFAQDDGAGNLVGDDVDPSGTNIIDYDTGSFRVTFKNPPGLNVGITAAYSQLLRVSSDDIPIDKHQVAVPGRYVITTEVVES